MTNGSAAEIAARVARYQRSRDLGVLWPDVAEATFHTAHGAIARATAALLAAPQAATPVELPPYGDPRAFGVAALVSGMGPLLGYWSAQGRLVTDETVAGLLAAHLEHGRKRAARLAQELRRILAAFHERGITVVLLKAADTARRYFPDPGTRPAADIDLLVAPERVTAAHAALGALGLAQQEGMTLPHRSEWVPVGVAQEVQSLDFNHESNPWALDLHTSLDRELYPGVRAALGPVDVAAQVPSGSSAGTRVLDQPLLLAYAACNASHDFTTLQLVRLVELALVVRRDFAARPGAWDAFASFVAQRGIERFVYPGLELADRLVPGTLDPSVRRRLLGAVPPRLRRVVDRTDVATLIRFRPLWVSARLMWATGVRDSLMYLAYLAWPITPGGPVGLGQFFRQQRRRLGRLLARVRQR